MRRLLLAGLATLLEFLALARRHVEQEVSAMGDHGAYLAARLAQPQRVAA